MTKTLGFIGAGNMGRALINGIKNEKLIIHILDSDKKKLSEFKDENLYIADNLKELLEKSDIIFLSIKPQGMEGLLKDISEYGDLIKDKVFVIIAAGLKKEFYKRIIKDIKIIRTMPNMPLSIGLGVTTVLLDREDFADEYDFVIDLLKNMGLVQEVEDESLFDVLTAVAGSGPAFVFSFIRALEDSLVKEGIDKEDARQVASMTLIGSASYAKENPMDLSLLIDSICSPQGTSIEGVKVLEANNFEDIIKKAVKASKDRSREMSLDFLGEKPECSDVDIYTDGACRFNPGPGGYAAILMACGKEKEITGFKQHTTNNEMELKAALEGLKALKRPSKVTLYSDSAYLVNGFNLGWVSSWSKNGWTRPKNEPIKNLELWQELFEMNKVHSITWVKVKGHADNEYNNRCDRLANQAILENT